MNYKTLLVLYYSMYGHIETLAQAVVEGARSVDGAATYADGDGSRQPSENELSIARYQGEKAAKLLLKR
jgi:multimeric flavodoxin WrbA